MATSARTESALFRLGAWDRSWVSSIVDALEAGAQRRVETIEREWTTVCDLAQLSEVDRRRLWHSAFLNPYATEGY